MIPLKFAMTKDSNTRIFGKRGRWLSAWSRRIVDLGFQPLVLDVSIPHHRLPRD